MAERLRCVSPPASRQHRLPGYGAASSACERSGQWPRALELADALEREVSEVGMDTIDSDL